MDNIKSEKLNLLEDTKDIKEVSTRFFSKLDAHYNKIYYFKTSYDKSLDKMITRNKVGSNIEAEKS